MKECEKLKIEINLKIFLLMVLLIFINKIEIYILFIIFIMSHELSHMCMGMILGFKPKTLKLNPLGLSIEFYNYEENSSKNRWKRIVTYIAGPVMNLFLAIIFYFINIETMLKTKIIYTNLLIGIFNLIPILPLDGGKILKEILKIFYNRKTVSIFMIYITRSILFLLTLTYSIAIFKLKNITIYLLILYLWYVYLIEEKKERLVIRVYETIEKSYK